MGQSAEQQKNCKPLSNESRSNFFRKSMRMSISNKGINLLGRERFALCSMRYAGLW
jgi:hypothetical protein